MLDIQINKEKLNNYYTEPFPEIIDSTERYSACNWCFKNNPFPEIRNRYKEPQRFYHNENHLNELLSLIVFLEDKFLINKQEASILTIIAFFHDAIYDPMASDNEEKSASLFLESIIRDLEFVSGEFGYTEESKKKIIKKQHQSPDKVFEIYQAILDTKTHKASNPISEIFCQLDLFCLTNYNLKELIEYEHNIFKEYQFVDYIIYHQKRIKILNELIELLPVKNPNLTLLIEYIKNRKVKVGLYPGSFRPFHVGHLDILRKAESILDKVVICKGINPAKSNVGFESTFDFKPQREVKNFQGYQVYFLNDLNKKAREYEKTNNLGVIVEYVFIRGLRNHTDFDFEFNQLQYSKKLAKEKGQNFNVLFFCSEPELQHISSSDIRAMESFKSGSAKNLTV